MSESTLRHHVANDGLDLAFLDFLIHEHHRQTLPRLDMFWDYYRNDLLDSADDETRRYRAAQERGLPWRLTQRAAGSRRRNEIVIENDIAWRIHALTDFMLSKPVTLQSLAPQRERAELIETFLRQVLDANGGLGFLQDLALLGAVHGHVDVLLRTDDLHSLRSPLGLTQMMDEARQRDRIIEQAGRFVLEIIEAPRAIPVLDPTDYRRLEAYIVHHRRVLNQLDRDSILDRLRDRVLGGIAADGRRRSIECAQVWSDALVTEYEGSGDDRRRVKQEINRLGRIPVVHIQNLPQPFFYDGLSEVEPLIPLQDELNTRLSDRANRVTFQSFKMYLGKGIEGFLDRPVGPGQMWATDNPDASIQQFGGDGACPSEDLHIAEIREAMDKASTVTPLAAGVIRDRVGNLTSENALRVTLLGMLSRTEKKRVTYGQGLERLCELILHAADVLGVMPNEPNERRVRLDWPSPLPENTSQRLDDAKKKLELGVPRGQVLAELGYAECPA